jgi:hypothetical protein
MMHPSFTGVRSYPNLKFSFVRKNRKYASLRRRLVLSGNESQTALVSVIAASIGARVGAIRAVIAPLVILSLIVVMRVGIEAFCRMQEQEIHTYRPFGDEQ